VHDDVLGWTVGPARSSHDGLYASSIEGLRSATPGESLAPLRARRRIAIVGDSYTFGMGVPFADTWGEALRRRLGDDFVVLNFGVDGYGVDQACLRYREDARAWKPDLVILGLIAHDVYRSTVVYPFISFPTWQFPFSKPRLVPGADGLRAVNLPLAAPRELFAVADISALPHVDLEPGYLASDWDRRWYHRSYSVRLATSLLPAWPAGHDDNAARDLNAAILAEFAADVRRAGGTPLVVYFPSYGTGEIGGRAGQRPARMVQVARSALAEAGLDYLDLTGCMAGLAAADGVAADGAHFSAAANDRIAGCLHDHLRELGLVLPATP
jgi:lysophospholipase L1-like esterase